MDLLAIERMHRLQAEAHRRRARVAREKLGINDYSTLDDRLEWANTLGTFKHLGKGALGGALAGSLLGLGFGAGTSNSIGASGLAGAIGGTFVGGAAGLIAACIKSTRGSLAAMDQPSTRESIRQEYADIMKRKPSDISLYDAARFSTWLHNYISDNTSRQDDLQSYAF